MVLTTGSAEDFRTSITRTLKMAAASPSAWFYTALWSASALVLAVAGAGPSVLVSLMVGLVLLLLGLLVAGITQPAPAAAAPAGGRSAGGTGTGGPGTTPPRRRVRVQLGIGLAFVVLTGWNNLAFHHVLPEGSGLPGWTALVEWLRRLGEQWFGAGLGTFVVNPVTYVAIPLALLLLAGARPSSMGFGPGHRVGRALLICCALPFAWFVFVLATGQSAVSRLLGNMAADVVQSGFVEEFLFRGILQTRLRLLAGTGWALVLQALLFGVWHLGLGFSNTGHAGLVPAIASTVVHQSLLGLALGILFERTRNLLVPSVVHVALNSMG